MNPNFDNQNEYTGKSLFDEQPKQQMGYGQPPSLPLPPSRKKHTLVIIITVAVVAIALLAGLAIALNSAERQTANETSSATISDTEKSTATDSQAVAESFLDSAIKDDVSAAKSQMAPQFKASTTDEQLKKLFTTFSSYMGSKAASELSDKTENATIKFADSEADNPYEAVSYLFNITSEDSPEPFYFLVNVVRIDSQWLVYGFQYDNNQIEPDVNTTGTYSLKP